MKCAGSTLLVVTFAAPLLTVFVDWNPRVSCEGK
jgi:hypothetical protein